jgi:ubiquinone/menaquinone biosynthesis C-methylase UbiE
MTTRPTAAGKSSFDLIEADRLFAALELKENTTLLDLACGRGAYALAAGKYIGRKGRVCALDLWQEGIDLLRQDAAARGFDHVEALVADVGRRLPFEDRCVDVCLVATVLHDLIQDRIDQAALKEVARVLKDQGTLALVEFKKMDGPPGPPIRIRLSPEESAAHLQPFGFVMTRQLDIGPYHYLALFTYHASKP